MACCMRWGDISAMNQDEDKGDKICGSLVAFIDGAKFKKRICPMSQYFYPNGTCRMLNLRNAHVSL